MGPFVLQWSRVLQGGGAGHEATPLQEVVRELHNCLGRDSSGLKLPRRLMGNLAAPAAAKFCTIPSTCSDLPSWEEVLLCQRSLYLQRIAVSSRLRHLSDLSILQKEWERQLMSFFMPNNKCHLLALMGELRFTMKEERGQSLE